VEVSKTLPLQTSEIMNTVKKIIT